MFDAMAGGNAFAAKCLTQPGPRGPEGLRLEFPLICPPYRRGVRLRRNGFATHLVAPAFTSDSGMDPSHLSAFGAHRWWHHCWHHEVSLAGAL